MEIKDIKKYLNNYNIIGVVGNYESSFKNTGKVKDLQIKNIDKALKMVNLKEDILNYNLNDLTISEFWKVELMSKLENDIIIVGNMFNSLIYKDFEYMKKLFIKLSNEYNKKIIVIDNNLKSFFNLTQKIIIVENKKVVYECTDFFDNNLDKYLDKSPIINFIQYVNKDKKILAETTDIYELIKDIYRRIS